jgi:outer membrane protein assembly factor BamB
MRHLWFYLLSAVVVVSMWAADWPMPAGNPQRNGWAGAERRINKGNVGGLKLLYKYQADNQSKGVDGLSAPIISGNLITYRGFKEMLMFTGSSDKVFSVDADLNKLLWESHLPYAAAKPASTSSTVACPGGLTAPVVTAGSSSASLHFAAIAARTPVGMTVRSARPNPYLPPLTQSVYPLLPTTLTQLNALYSVSSDGYLHVLNSSTGEDLIPAVRFVPPNAKVTSLNLQRNIVYATTADNCDGYRNALFAIDLLSPQKEVSSFVLPEGEFAGTAGTAIGNDGTIYVQAAFAPEGRAGRYYDTVVALTPKDLKVKDYFTLSDKPLKKARNESRGITPIVFSFPGRDLVIAGGRNGGLYLLDSRSLGGTDHHTPLFASAALTESSKNSAANGFRGVFSTWTDVDTGSLRFYAPVFGKVRSPAAEKIADPQANGYIAAFELRGTDEKPALTPLWVSHGMMSPSPAVIAAGMVFVLATGDPSAMTKKDGKPYSVSELKQLAQPANLYVLDAITGKELFSSGRMPASSSLSGGLAFANSRAYFAGQDNAVYCFGIPGQQSQLAEQ